MSSATTLTTEQLLTLLQLKAGITHLDGQEKTKYETILNSKRVTVGEAMDLVDLMTRPLIAKYNEVMKSKDVIEHILAHKLKVSEETFEKAEKEVEALNEEARDKYIKEFQEKVEELRNTELAEEVGK